MAERMQALLARAAEEQLTEQRQVSSVLGELRALITGLGEQLRSTASSARLDSLGGDVCSLSAGLSALHDQLSPLPGVRTALVELTERLDRLEALTSRPVLSQEGLEGALAPLLAQLEELTVLRAEVDAVRAGVVSLQEDTPLPSLVLDVAGLREDVAAVALRVADVRVPTAEAVAVAVEGQLVDPLVDALAPRVAELVLDRVAATLVEQVADSVTVSVQQGLTERVRAVSAESERRISAHVDEAVLVLAEALLRRRRLLRSVAGGLAEPPEDGGAPPEAAVASGPDAGPRPVVEE